jgi:hypothetical protein
VLRVAGGTTTLRELSGGGADVDFLLRICSSSRS